jgi:uncharacterized membrane protein YhaH (DUF805 family)
MKFQASLNSVSLKNYANFNGRASRSEYWWFFLFVLVTCVVLAFIEDALSIPKATDTGGILVLIFQIATIIPLLAVGTRRLHDGHTSGKWQFLSFTVIGIIPLLIMFASKGDDKENEYGPKPKS